MHTIAIFNLAALAGGALAVPVWPNIHWFEGVTSTGATPEASRAAWTGVATDAPVWTKAHHPWDWQTRANSRTQISSVTTEIQSHKPSQYTGIPSSDIGFPPGTTSVPPRETKTTSLATDFYPSSAETSSQTHVPSLTENATQTTDAYSSKIETSTSTDVSSTTTDAYTSTTQAPTTTAESPSTSETPSQTTSASQSSSTLNDFQSSILQEHNVLRAKHNATAMTWDDDLADAANQAAKLCQFDHFMSFNGGGYGQNLAAGPTQGKDVADYWYGEVKDYTDSYGHDNPVGNADTGHFTQMVWKASTKLGCAINTCPDNAYVYCNYKEEGNMGGEYAENVQAPLAGY